MSIRSFMRSLSAVGCLMAVLLTGCSAAETPAAEPTVPVVTEPVPTVSPYTIENIGGTDCYSISGMRYAAVLGAPVLGKDAVSELYKADDYDAAADQINNIGDALCYLSKAGRFINPREACRFFARLIVDDYNAVGFIEFRYTDNKYCLVYVEHDGMYYAFDAFDLKSQWIINSKNGCISGTDINALSEKLLPVFHSPGTELVSVDIVEDVSKPHGAEEFFYIGTSFPEGLGRPVLTDAEIDALIAEQDYAKTAETITTLADAVNYYKRAGFAFKEGADMNRIGNLHYVQSAWQVLKDNKGQCVTMSNLNHYLLQGDYDEVGYVQVSTPGDGHVMTYILEEGIYYLVNSVDYAPVRRFGWLESYTDVLGSAADFQGIADSLVNNMRLGDKELVDRVHLVNSPGDIVFGRQGNKDLYPKECTVTEYYGYGVEYGETSLDWQSQTRIDY